jgi:leucyl aminopeptidase
VGRGAGNGTGDRGDAAYTAAPVKVSIVSSQPEAVDADLLCLGVFDEEGLPGTFATAPGADDLETGFKKLTMLRPERPSRVLAVGLGPRGEFDSERARVAAALAVRQAKRYRAATIAWLPPTAGAAVAAALVSGSILAAYDFTRLKSEPAKERPPEGLLLLGAEQAEEIVEVARIAAEAANRARDLQNLPANVADPAYLIGRANEIAAGHPSLSAEILGAEELTELGMGGLLAVAAGSQKDPALIVLRHDGGAGVESLCIVGKAVTFDSGGISLKPSASMHEMKMDMSGGAAALEATGAIAELGLPVDLLTVVPAVENMPSGSATRPGDVITQYSGKTVEVNNTDAEGRLILADALSWAVEQGAERIVDLATLTGAVLIGLGSTYAAVIANDDVLAEQLDRSGAVTGELVWRLPMHREYRELMRGTVADLTNASPKRKAGTITAAAFLEEFVGEAGWAHIDIAGTSWDVGREYVGKGPTGFGVRLLVELARELAGGGSGPAGSSN